MSAKKPSSDEMLADIHELLARAWGYSDKPHLLFSHLMVMADKYEGRPEFRRETIALMDYAYDNRGAPKPIKK